MTQNLGMGGHHSTVAKTDTWLTPPEILAPLGAFDLDPCVPPVMPWPTAARSFNERDDGLAQEWAGRIWCNPPYGPETVKWLRRMAEHRNGIAFVFARTETAWFFETVWRQADAVLFLEGRVHFHHADGTRAAANAGAPSCLVAYGGNNRGVLRHCGVPGHFVDLGRA